MVALSVLSVTIYEGKYVKEFINKLFSMGTLYLLIFQVIHVITDVYIRIRKYVVGAITQTLVIANMKTFNLQCFIFPNC